MLVLTQGDPASIAPEITAAVWQALRQSGPAFVYVGDPSLLERRVPVQTIRYLSDGADVFGHALPVLPLHLATPPHRGSRTAAMPPVFLRAFALPRNSP